MGKRLSKIYTRTGDDGTTGLGDGTRVPKDSWRVDAFGRATMMHRFSFRPRPPTPLGWRKIWRV